MTATQHLKSIPTIKEIGKRAKKFLRLAANYSKFANLWVSPGHYYSPIPDIKSVSNQVDRLLDKTIDEIPGINLNIAVQKHQLQAFKPFIDEMRFPDHKSNDVRYFYQNEMYSYGDAVTLYSILRSHSPKKIIEVGSGYTTALVLDVKDAYLPKLDITCIEPYPQRLYEQLHDGDLDKINLKVDRLENINLNVFKSLNSGDILFIDSSHVSKLGSDVNYYLFNILPRLKRGVLIHIHDISWPFEYGKDLIEEGRFWNEAYVVRSFLQFNNSFEIIFWPSYLLAKYPSLIKPYANFNKAAGPGGNIWLKKVR